MKYRFDYSAEIQNNLRLFNNERGIDDEKKQKIYPVEVSKIFGNFETKGALLDLLTNWNLLAQAHGDIIELEMHRDTLSIKYFFNEFYSFLKNDNLLRSVISETTTLCDFFRLKKEGKYFVLELFCKII